MSLYSEVCDGRLKDLNEVSKACILRKIRGGANAPTPKAKQTKKQ
jgi:hypothetical protein